MKRFLYVTLLCLLFLTACGTNTNNSANFTIDELNAMLKEAEERAATFVENTELIINTIETVTNGNISSTTITTPDDYDYVLIFPSDKYPETALHIFGAIEQGHSDVCTIDREGAEDNRKESLRGINTKQGFDRDEWPMAMCGEGGKGASVAYISASDNRGAGSWVGNELSQYKNGERVLFIVEKPTQLFPTDVEKRDDKITYNSCEEVKAANASPLKKGDPGYSTKLDRDGDGVACEA